MIEPGIRLGSPRAGPPLAGRGPERAAIADRGRDVVDGHPRLTVMELVVDVTETDGRLQGTVRRSASTVTHPFSGTLELLAWLERLGGGEDGEDTARIRPTGETS